VSLPPPPVQFPLFINLGVELGQLQFIGPILMLLALMRRRVTLPQSAPIGAAYGLGALATFWILERLDTMFF